MPILYGKFMYQKKYVILFKKLLTFYYLYVNMHMATRGNRQKIYILYKRERLFMFKKLIAGAMAAGMLVCGISAFACDCGDKNNTTYEYYMRGDGTHETWAVCHNSWCGSPYNRVGIQECEYSCVLINGIGYLQCEQCGDAIEFDW